jgi:hypothetical protein
MQMFWSSMFTRRMVFNAAHALVKQMDRTGPDDPPKTFSSLQPVYMLALVNSRFPYKDEDKWLYYYKVADIENPRRVLEGLNFVVIDLETDDLVRKIRAQQGWTMEKKRMAVLWLRFLKEVGYAETVDRELAEDQTIGMAVDICEEGAFTREDMDVYDAYWDHVRIELGYMEYVEENKSLHKAFEEQAKLIADKDKALEDKDKALEDQAKALEDQAKLIADLTKLIEDRKKH